MEFYHGLPLFKRSPLRRTLRGASLTLLAVSFLYPAVAQEGPSVPWFRGEAVEVNLATFYVHVSDREGAPVTGLEREDFEIRASGHNINITHFGAAEHQPLFLAVCIDDFNTDPRMRRRVLEVLGPFLEQRICRGDLVQLTSLNSSLRIQQDFTGDPEVLKSSLRKLTRAKQLHRRRDLYEVGQAFRASCYEPNSLSPYGYKTQDMFHPITSNGKTAAPSTFPPPGMTFRSLYSPFSDPTRRDHPELALRQIEVEISHSVDELRRTVETFSGLPGRKALILVSGGLPITTGAGYLGTKQDLCWNKESIDSSLLLSSGILRHFEGLADRLSTHQVEFYWLGGKNSNRYGTAMLNFDDMALLPDLQNPLTLLADRTGGQEIPWSSKFSDDLDLLGKGFDAQYSLGFKPPDSSAMRRLELHVKMRDPSLRARHAETLYFKSLEQQGIEGTLSTLVHGYIQNPLSMRIHLGERQDFDRELYHVPVDIRIPLENIALIPTGEDHRLIGQLSLFMLFRDNNGQFSEPRSVDLPINVPQLRPDKPGKSIFVHRVRLLVRELRYEIAICVRDAFGGKTSCLKSVIAADKAPRAVAPEGVRSEQD